MGSRDVSVAAAFTIDDSAATGSVVFRNCRFSFDWRKWTQLGGLDTPLLTSWPVDELL